VINKGITFLGFRIFYYHKLLKKSNMKRIKKKNYEILLKDDLIDFEKIQESIQGIFSYMKHANTYKLRKELSTEILNQLNH
jgi:hypothetical protein